MSFALTPRLDFVVSEDFGYQEPVKYFGSILINGQVDKSLREVNYNVEDADIHYKDSWTQFKTEWRPLRKLVVRNNFNVLVSKGFWHDVETYAYVPASNRWLYHGLHNLDFPFLYYRRPLWDVVMIVLSAGGLALSVTTLVPSWRRLVRHGRRLRPAVTHVSGVPAAQPAASLVRREAEAKARSSL